MKRSLLAASCLILLACSNTRQNRGGKKDVMASPNNAPNQARIDSIKKAQTANKKQNYKDTTSINR